MEPNEFIKVFKESFDTLSSTISLETNYKQLDEWNSMQALLLIAHIDDMLAVVLEAEDIKNTNTINDLYELVNEKL